jgi:hypothetical protein
MKSEMFVFSKGVLLTETAVIWFWISCYEIVERTELPVAA